MNIEIGNTFTSNGYGEYKIIASELKLRNNSKRRDRKYLVKFNEYNGVKYEKWCDKKEILNGSIKNPFYPKRYGVGYIGELGKKIDNKIYAIWSAMLSRCYNLKNIQYKYYGERGVLVCERWHNYSNFYIDYINMKGYNPNKRQDLDKDILQKDIPKNYLNPQNYNLK